MTTLRGGQERIIREKIGAFIKTPLPESLFVFSEITVYLNGCDGDLINDLKS